MSSENFFPKENTSDIITLQTSANCDWIKQDHCEVEIPRSKFSIIKYSRTLHITSVNVTLFKYYFITVVYHSKYMCIAICTSIIKNIHLYHLYVTHLSFFALSLARNSNQRIVSHDALNGKKVSRTSTEKRELQVSPAKQRNTQKDQKINLRLHAKILIPAMKFKNTS